MLTCFWLIHTEKQHLTHMNFFEFHSSFFYLPLEIQITIIILYLCYLNSNQFKSGIELPFIEFSSEWLSTLVTVQMLPIFKK